MITAIPSTVRTAALKLGMQKNWWVYTDTEDVVLNLPNTLVTNAAGILSKFTDRAAVVPVTDLDPAALKFLTDTHLLVVDGGVARCGIGWWTPKSAPAPVPTPGQTAPGIERVQPQPRPYDQMDEGLHAPVAYRKPQAPGTSPTAFQGAVAGGSITADPALLQRAVAALEMLADQAGSPMIPITPVGDSPVLDCARELAVLMSVLQPATRHVLRERVRSRLRQHTSAALEMGVSKGAFTLVGSPVRGGEYSLSDPEVLGMDWSVVRSLASGRKPARALVSTSS
ncbi:hypothetical protein AWC04_08480 [Mycolicibacterium fallax]|uniref:Uncharacterized protein n=2 Tax=Mycolicibacterium fallax TaxID=1793 RepID=A0A1X1RFJ7_MYCFA|nr:hypothetical protein AWC04_08480 [Mycolicibacterium fallax]